MTFSRLDVRADWAFALLVYVLLCWFTRQPSPAEFQFKLKYSVLLFKEQIWLSFGLGSVFLYLFEISLSRKRINKYNISVIQLFISTFFFGT